MKHKLLLAAAILVVGAVMAKGQVNAPPMPPVQCTSTARYDAATAGTTQLIPAVTGKQIYVCGFILWGGSGQSNNLQLRAGTGTNCATGQNNLTPSFAVTSAQGVIDSSPFNRGIITAVAEALCLTREVASSAQGIIYFSQF